MDNYLSEMLRALQILKCFYGLLKWEYAIDVRVNLVELGKLQ